MSIVDDVVQGSYAGIPFLTSKSSVSGGRKDVLKKFINSDDQTVEDRPRR